MFRDFLEYKGIKLGDSQRETLELFVKTGKTLNEIARERILAPPTIRGHIEQISEKIGGSWKRAEVQAEYIHWLEEKLKGEG